MCWKSTFSAMHIQRNIYHLNVFPCIFAAWSQRPQSNELPPESEVRILTGLGLQFLSPVFFSIQSYFFLHIFLCLDHCFYSGNVECFGPKEVDRHSIVFVNSFFGLLSNFRFENISYNHTYPCFVHFFPQQILS